MVIRWGITTWSICGMSDLPLWFLIVLTAVCGVLAILLAVYQFIVSLRRDHRERMRYRDED